VPEPGIPCCQVGALPWRTKNGRARVLLVTARNKRRWIIPKGHPSKRLNDASAAAREAEEEGGVRGIIREPIGCYVHRRPGRKPITVTVYGLEVTSKVRNWQERSQRRRKWVSPHKALQLVDDPELRRLLSSYLRGGGLG
jgi:8-oxo-dGTP pyrophosphatase MutT (NUDIX family)